jgi:hypothetical protein
VCVPFAVVLCMSCALLFARQQATSRAARLPCVFVMCVVCLRAADLQELPRADTRGGANVGDLSVTLLARVALSAVRFLLRTFFLHALRVML